MQSPAGRPCRPRAARALAALALALASLALVPLPRADAAVAVGLGSYTTTLPAGRQVPSDSAGAPVAPKITGNVAGAVPTNQWWSSLVWPRNAGNPYSENMYPHPLAVRATSGGLGVGYPTVPAISTGSPPYIGEYHYSYAPDLTLGVVGLGSPDARVDGYSDWTVTAYWASGPNSLRATFGHGLPFVYATKTGADALVAFIATPTIWANAGSIVGATVNGHHYGIFGPSGSTWTPAGTSLQSSLAGKDYFSVALLPDNTPATLAFFASHAYAFVTSAAVSWSYNAATAQLTTTFTATTTPKEGSATNALLGLYRHQWLNTASPLTAHSYVTPRGTMKLLDGNTFSTMLTFGGVLPALPDRGDYDRAALNAYVNAVYGESSHFPPGAGTYWTGKALGRLAALVPIADQLGNTTARDSFLGAMKAKLQDWVQAPDGKTSNLFYYHGTWGTLIGYPAEYGSDTELNDHHFHYGYFIQAAATIAQYDPAWASDGQWGGMVRLLVKDPANWDRADTRFPRLRTFDPYAGHSWAAGHAAFGAGNNQESSSEAMNFAAGLVLWGAATGDTTIRDLGIFLYATEASAIAQYWFDVDGAVFPAGFNHSTTHPAVGIVWGDGGAYATWFSGEPEKIHGINFLPITGGSLHLGRDPAYVTLNYSRMQANIGGPERSWQDVIWAFAALADPAGAASKLAANPGYTPEDGESRAHTDHWVRNLNMLGAVDPAVTANVPTYAVFKKGSVRTYVAYNPAASPVTVTFSDGTALAVPARALVASNASTAPPATPSPTSPPGATATPPSGATTTPSPTLLPGATTTPAPTSPAGPTATPTRTPIPATPAPPTATPPAPTPQPPTPVPAAPCAPRPNVAISSAPGGPGRLQVAVTAQTSAGTPTNDLRELRFVGADNAQVELNGQARAVPFSLPLAAGTQQATFVVTRTAPGQAARVDLVAVDRCGDWPTFVGGGASAF